jgi:hypothetical protein
MVALATNVEGRLEKTKGEIEEDLSSLSCLQDDLAESIDKFSTLLSIDNAKLRSILPLMDLHLVVTALYRIGVTVRSVLEPFRTLSTPIPHAITPVTPIPQPKTAVTPSSSHSTSTPQMNGLHKSDNIRIVDNNGDDNHRNNDSHSNDTKKSNNITKNGNNDTKNGNDNTKNNNDNTKNGHNDTMNRTDITKNGNDNHKNDDKNGNNDGQSVINIKNHSHTTVKGLYGEEKVYIYMYLCRYFYVHIHIHI